MNSRFNDTVALMLEEIDQMVVDDLHRQPDYLADQREYLSLVEKLRQEFPSPGLERCLVLSTHLQEMERRSALLLGMAAGTGFRRIFDGTNKETLDEFLHSSFLMEMETE